MHISESKDYYAFILLPFPMLISIKVIPNAKKEFVKEENGVLKVHVKVPAVEGKANKAVIELLSDHFRVKKNTVHIIKGERAREKVIDIKEQ